MTDALDVDINQVDTDSRKVRITAAGGILAALAASTCCINLTSLETYKPIFIVITLGFLGYGYWIVYRKSKACTVHDTCARPLPSRLVKSALWTSTLFIMIALFWSWIAPVVTPILLGF